MARPRGFVPAFDRLGARITPSNVAPVVAAPGSSEVSMDIIDSIKWILPEDPLPRDLTECEKIIETLDWVLPLTATTE